MSLPFRTHIRGLPDKVYAGKTTDVDEEAMTYTQCVSGGQFELESLSLIEDH